MKNFPARGIRLPVDSPRFISVGEFQVNNYPFTIQFINKVFPVHHPGGFINNDNLVVFFFSQIPQWVYSSFVTTDVSCDKHPFQWVSAYFIISCPRAPIIKGEYLNGLTHYIKVVHVMRELPDSNVRLRNLLHSARTTLSRTRKSRDIAPLLLIA